MPPKSSPKPLDPEVEHAIEAIMECYDADETLPRDRFHVTLLVQGYYAAITPVRGADQRVIEGILRELVMPHEEPKP